MTKLRRVVRDIDTMESEPWWPHSAMGYGLWNKDRNGLAATKEEWNAGTKRKNFENINNSNRTINPWSRASNEKLNLKLLQRATNSRIFRWLLQIMFIWLIFSLISNVAAALALFLLFDTFQSFSVLVL